MKQTVLVVVLTCKVFAVMAIMMIVEMKFVEIIVQATDLEQTKEVQQ